MRIWIFVVLAGLCLAKQEDRNDKSNYYLIVSLDFSSNQFLSLK
jgi:hypothetical protein